MLLIRPFVTLLGSQTTSSYFYEFGVSPPPHPQGVNTSRQHQEQPSWGKQNCWGSSVACCVCVDWEPPIHGENIVAQSLSV